MAIKNQYLNSGVDGAGGYEFFLVTQFHCVTHTFIWHSVVPNS